MFYIIFCNPDMCYSAALESSGFPCGVLIYLFLGSTLKNTQFFPTFMHLSDVSLSSCEIFC